MKPLNHDIHILEHIVSYCQQIEETVARFGNDGSIFPQILFIETQPLSVSSRKGLNISHKGRFPNWHIPNLGNRPI